MEAKGSVLPIMSKRSGKRNCFGVMPTNSAYWARATAFSGVRVTLVFIFWEIKAKLGQVAVQIRRFLGEKFFVSPLKYWICTRQGSNLQPYDPKSYTLSICTAGASENGLADARRSPTTPLLYRRGSRASLNTLDKTGNIA
jgi:hypothetical protein